MSLLLAQHASTDEVAFGRAGRRTLTELLRDAELVRAALPAPNAGSRVLLAIRADRYAFCAALLGTWAAGHTVALPPVDVTREAFLKLAQSPEIAAVVHDTVSGAAIRIDRLLANPESSARLDLGLLERHDVGVTLYEGTEARELTSNTLRRSQLLDEAVALARVCALPPRAHCWASVLPESRYGLVLGVLWPLISGGVCLRELFAPELSGASVSSGGPAAARVLISGPAQLRMLLRARATLFDALDHVVAGGAPIALPQAALASLREHPQLRVHDLAEPSAPDGARQLAEELAWWPGVADAAVLELRAATPNVARRYLALAADGCSESALRARLTDRLPDVRFERVAILPHPACALARGGTGEHRRERLLRLFDLGADGRPLAFEVDVRFERTQPAGYHCQVHVPANYVYFEGHFPGYPLLPGAAQLSELVLPCVRRARADLGRLARMTRLKFQERIKPNELIDVFLVFASQPDSQQIDFSLKRGETLCAAGRLTFEMALGETERVRAQA